MVDESSELQSAGVITVRRVSGLRRWLDGLPDGWRVLGASVIVNAISDGTWFYGFSVFFLPISRDRYADVNFPAGRALTPEQREPRHRERGGRVPRRTAPAYGKRTTRHRRSNKTCVLDGDGP